MDAVKPLIYVKMINKIAIFFGILIVSISARGKDIGTFSYLGEKDRINCVKMFERGDLKYDKVADIYFKEKKTPLSGMQKQYVCNKPNQTKDAFSNLVNTMNNLDDYKTIEGKNNQIQKNERIVTSPQSGMRDSKQNSSESGDNILGDMGAVFKSLIPGGNLVGQSNNNVNNMNQTENSVKASNSEENNQDTSILGSATAFLGFGVGQDQSNIYMRNALLSLNKAQVNFLKALEEDELALATQAYVKNLESGTVLGDDYLEKALVQSKENQELINKKMQDVEKMSVEAKAEFAKGIPNYSLGLASLVKCGFSFKNTVDGLSGGIGGILSGIGLAVTAKDALTAIPLFFSSSSKIIKFSKQNDINSDELEKAKETLGT